MRILLATLGSRGDVQPFVALGAGLRGAGHDVTVCTHTRFEAFVTSRGLSYAYLSDELIAILDTAEGRGAVEDMGSFFSGVRAAVKLLRRTGPIQRDLLNDGWAAARDIRPDIIVYHGKMGGTPHYADKLGIPCVLALTFPQFVPTSEFPTLGFPNLGGRFNRMTYRFVVAIAKRIGGKYVNAWREEQVLPPMPRGTDLLHRTDGSRIPVVHAVSPNVVPPPPDWPDGVINTGYWFLDRDADWQPPEGLDAFLSAGEVPVYVGFGSMAGRNPQKVTAVVVDALRQTGLRAVLASGWGGLSADDLPDSAYLVDAVPHDWLFPRVAAVVHHGGAGTTAAGLRAGRPTVICPFFGDQPFWGRRVHALGAGPTPIPQKRLTAVRLAEALRMATTDSEIARRAEALGAAIRTEDGIGDAVRFVERAASTANHR